MPKLFLFILGHILHWNLILFENLKIGALNFFLYLNIPNRNVNGPPYWYSYWYGGFTDVFSDSHRILLCVGWNYIFITFISVKEAIIWFNNIHDIEIRKLVNVKIYSTIELVFLPKVLHLIYESFPKSLCQFTIRQKIFKKSLKSKKTFEYKISQQKSFELRGK